MRQVMMYEAVVDQAGRVRLCPAIAGFYRDNQGWMSKSMACDFSSGAEAVVQQMEDALNWVLFKNPECTVQLVPAGGAIPSGTFWVIASPRNP